MPETFDQSKFTFDANQKQPLYQAAKNYEIVGDGGVSFGGAALRLDNGSTHLSFNDLSDKNNLKSFH